jgi:DNA-directed RNA polymerase I subunit RPA2
MNILSWVASFTPFSDMNQSPRNMYQCQMAKQTMGSPCHNYAHRTDNKMYRLQTPQAPMIYNENHENLRIDDFSNGTNAIVAVISYTGYDMEDAVIINKASYERGFGHGTMYKTTLFDVSGQKERVARKSYEYIQLPPKSNRGNIATATGRALADAKKFAKLGPDAVIPVGAKVTKGTPLVCIYNKASGAHRFESHKSAEPAVVDEVRFIGNESNNADGGVRAVSIKLRYDRNPVVGDKFASRHGQKGVLSWLWPQADMPFSGSGVNPDIIINPHAFPSRMTIGMLLESMAGKSCALAGKTQDSTPFKFNEKQRAVDYVGSELAAAGYNYYGTEELYSGITGCKMQADVFIGVVYYQRLRHMVKDKSQVRSSGPINQLTRQPVKGRKKHGGIRFGEMERDALIGHGVAFLVHDRLMNCSDRHIAEVCTRCKSILSPCRRPQTAASSGTMYCRACDGPDGTLNDDSELMLRKNHSKNNSKDSEHKIARIVIPYVVRYLVNQLAAMNVKVAVDVAKYTSLRDKS